jgi:hypothetical protein
MELIAKSIRNSKSSRRSSIRKHMNYLQRKLDWFKHRMEHYPDDADLSANVMVMNAFNFTKSNKGTYVLNIPRPQWSEYID